MATRKLSEGVGKKIVEALKKQSEIEINPILSEDQDEIEILNDEINNAFSTENEESQETVQESDFMANLSSEGFASNPMDEHSDSPLINEFVNRPESPMPSQTFINYQQPAPSVQDNFISELDNFEIPSNIAVLKKLITQLPSGVTRHTGAQIIKQTMEALGISMKSVLQEAQQVQEGLNNSAKECYSTIQEYKKQIMTLEKQAQSHQKQYTALNDLISLFIQTGV